MSPGFGVERKSGFHRLPPFDERAGVFGHCGSVLESMARTPSQQPDIFEIWMAIDQEIAAGCVLVLAYAAFEERRGGQSRKALG